MPVLERSELEASPLADLHAIADQLGIEGFRRMRKDALIDAILGTPQADGDAAGETYGDADGDAEHEVRAPRVRRRRSVRLRRSRDRDGEEHDAEDGAADGVDDVGADIEHPGGADVERSGDTSSGGTAEEPAGRAPAREQRARSAEGVVEVLGNGSAFLRVNPPEPSDEDVYISAAQVRRCELVSGDRVGGPVRTPRRSERYPSLVRVDTINGAPADTVSEGVHYDELPVAYPSERLALGADDRTLEAIEWLTPLGRGSRAVIVGQRHAGKTHTLRRLLDALHGRPGLELSLVLVGVRPEEIADWREGPVVPAAALGLGTSADAQDQAVERTLDTAKRVAARGGDALVLIDTLDGLHPHAARKALAAARNLREAGSLTIIATATAPFGGETTVIALDPKLTLSGRQPILDLAASGTLRPELLVGAQGAEAIARARASLEDGS
jgi:transcription termination factor Rho